MTPPRVTVICIFLDEERFLAEAVDSVLAQDFRDFELLLVDDGSADRSPELAQRYSAGDPTRVRYLEHPGHANRGISATRNLGLAHARGEYVAMIDGDDVWRPGKLAEQVALLDAMPEVGMVCGTVNYWESWAGGPDRLVATGGLRDEMIGPPDTTLRFYPLGAADAPGMSCAMIRRSIIERVGGFEDQFTGMYEDQAFLAKLYLAAPVYCSSKVWFDYRLHDDSCLSTAHSDGAYREVRGRFLDWFSDYLGSRSFPGKEQVSRALGGARWRLAHPFLARVGRRLQRAFGAA